ncbi:MAG: pyruvate kinase [Synergistetes bacterium]|nr:pyruvate kinase [Synergistota bacterium]MCX8127425.1 pyruvate kinase [Synergistota bacterium]MDW8192289.1 pyruvate kinase [Synergistota bacterium]
MVSLRRTKIIATLGPASSSENVLTEMVKEGMNVARLNFSHGTYETHGESLRLVREVEEKLKVPLAVMLDTKGPEIRTGKLKDKVTFLREGSMLVLTPEELEGDEKRVSISFPDLYKDVKSGDHILIDDGKIDLEVVEIRDCDIHCRVIVGGELGEKKGVNIPGVDISLPALSDKDISDIRWGVENGVDWFAISFVRKASDILEVRKVIEEAGGSTKIIAKIETRQAVQNFDEILNVSDGIMVARGDLGVELPTEEVPLLQKRFINSCKKVGKPVIVATQMLENMIYNPRPTRAEANDVANAIFDGADAVMLSGETAKGRYPIESVRVMRRIIEKAEEEILKDGGNPMVYITLSVPDAVSHASCTIARDLGASAIITATQSGSTARMVAKYRPICPIIATTPSLRTLRELVLTWGVYPLMISDIRSTDKLLEASINRALEAGYVREGDVVVLTAGVPVGVPGTTNLIKVHVIAKILVKGIGIGKGKVVGKAVLAPSSEDALSKVGKNSILVVKETDKDYVPVMDKVVGIVAEEGGLSSHAAIVGLQYGIPVIVGADGALGAIRDGMIISLDAERGVVYEGEVKLI